MIEKLDYIRCIKCNGIIEVDDLYVKTGNSKKGQKCIKCVELNLPELIQCYRFLLKRFMEKVDYITVKLALRKIRNYREYSLTDTLILLEYTGFIKRSEKDIAFRRNDVWIVPDYKMLWADYKTWNDKYNG